MPTTLIYHSAPYQNDMIHTIEKGSIFVIFLAATKFMEKHLISELICYGIVIKNHLFAIGYLVEKNSQDQMNFKGMEELILERKSLYVVNATKNS